MVRVAALMVGDRLLYLTNQPFAIALCMLAYLGSLLPPLVSFSCLAGPVHGRSMRIDAVARTTVLVKSSRLTYPMRQLLAVH